MRLAINVEELTTRDLAIMFRDMQKMPASILRETIYTAILTALLAGEPDMPNNHSGHLGDILASALKRHDKVSTRFEEFLAYVDQMREAEGAILRENQFTIFIGDPETSRKINIIKELRQLTGQGLKESKDLMEDACTRTVTVTLLQGTDPQFRNKSVADMRTYGAVISTGWKL